MSEIFWWMKILNLKFLDFELEENTDFYLKLNPKAAKELWEKQRKLELTKNNFGKILLFRKKYKNLQKNT